MLRPLEVAERLFVARVARLNEMTRQQLKMEARYCMDAACEFVNYAQDIRRLGNDDTVATDWSKRPPTKPVRNCQWCGLIIAEDSAPKKIYCSDNCRTYGNRRIRKERLDA
jgi:predicted nucleic acid-binding Zn ribbon protein